MWDKQTIRELSDRLVEAQRPIRILEAIKWDDSVEAEFFAKGCSEQPPVDRDYYERRPLGFDPAEKRREFHALERDIQARLGEFNPVGRIMRRMCREYRTAIQMLEARGLPEFSLLAQDLYGAAGDVFHEGAPTLADLGAMLTEILAHVDRSELGRPEPRTITSEQAGEILQKRLSAVFTDPNRPVRVVVSDGILADAAAGADYVKVRKGAFFNERDLRLLEVHEGWVHVGTTLNGLEQQTCTFLSKGPPSSTVTQEGLALLMEIISFSCHRQRLHRLTNRIRAVELVEKGGTFLDVFRFFCDQGFNQRDSYDLTTRVFRGSTPTGGPFTKDVSYSKGFVLIYQYIEAAVRRGLIDRIPLLFCGKTTLKDMRTLHLLVQEGIVQPPKYLPPQFADLNGLTAWLCYSNFLGKLDNQKRDADFADIL